jgi:hypothetical protein
VPGVFAQLIALGCAIELIRRRPALGVTPAPASARHEHRAV